MKQSTSFAQVATNQFDYLSSALCANTPPCKKHSSSRKFLTLSISLRLWLVMFLTLTVSAEVWGENIFEKLYLSARNTPQNSSEWTFVDANCDNAKSDYWKMIQHTSVVTSPEFDISGYTNVTIVIEWQTFGNFDTSKSNATIKVSTAEGEWTTLGTTGLTQKGSIQKTFSSVENTSSYNKAQIQISTPNADGSNGGRLISVTITGDVSSSSETPDSYTVNWSVNGTIEHSQTGVVGTTLTNIPNLENYECGDKVFVGWTTQSSYEHATDAPNDLITNTNGMTIPENGEDYYAVFAEKSGFDGNIDFCNQGWTAGQDLNELGGNGILQCGDVTITFLLNSANTAPQYIKDGKTEVFAVRLYPKNQMTVSASSNIESITFTHASGEDANIISCSSGSFSGTKWTGNTKSVTFTIGGDSGHRRITAINVQIAGGGNVTYSNYTTSCGQTYTITWKNDDGTILETDENVPYGTTPSYDGEEPIKVATEQYTYTHNGWTPNVVAVTDNAIYTATFTETPRTYTITLNTNGGTINAGNVTSYTYGVGATLPTNVTKENHQFGGWFDNSGCTGTAVTAISITATGNKEYWAKWTELPKYTVTWSVVGNTTTEEVYSGKKPTGAPTIDPNDLPCEGADKFVGWTIGEYKGDSAPGTLYPTANDIPAITGDITFYAVFADYAD